MSILHNLLECECTIEKISGEAVSSKIVAIFNNMESEGYLEKVAFDPRINRIKNLARGAWVA